MNSVCLYCEATLSPYINRLRDFRFGVPGTFRLARCTQCEALIADPMPDDKAIERFYASYYTHQPPPAPPKALQKLWPLPRRRRLDERRMTYYLTGERGRLLEIGCGAGERLLALRQEGWEVVGQDIDEAAGRLVRHTGIPVARRRLEDCGFQSESFDVVAMAHVMEHVRSPRSLLLRSWDLVAPGGSLVVIGPLATGFGRRVLGRHWASYHAPFHLAIPGIASMERLAQSAGIPAGTTLTNVLFADVVVATSLETVFRSRGLHGRVPYALRLLSGVASQCIATPLHLWHPAVGTEFTWSATKAA